MTGDLWFPFLLAGGVCAFGVICWIIAHAWQGRRKREERARVIRWRVAEIAGERRMRRS